MSLIVEKYGGTSLANVERIAAVARNVAASVRQGHKMLVVVSAMSGETNRLLALARSVNAAQSDGGQGKAGSSAGQGKAEAGDGQSNATQADARPSNREIDVLVSTGEQVTIALLAMALHSIGVAARSYTGAQTRILTDRTHGKARIVEIQSERVKRDLEAGTVVVVAGFQGVDEDDNITTLGRGGSDTTAVAMAAALRADECRIYTDVDGVYTADPRVVPEARRLERVTFEEMLELSGAGAKVLQIRSVEFAGKYNVPVRVLSSFEAGAGTLITYEAKSMQNSMEQPLISGITCNRDEAKVTIRGVPDKPGIAHSILGPISQANINVDMIVQNVGSDGLTDLTFTVNSEDLQQSKHILAPIADELGAEEIVGDSNLAKISVVGVGMRSHAGMATIMFKALSEKGINIQMISTSEIKISVTIDMEYTELAVRTLHKAFRLDEPVAETG